MKSWIAFWGHVINQKFWSIKNFWPFGYGDNFQWSLSLKINYHSKLSLKLSLRGQHHYHHCSDSGAVFIWMWYWPAWSYIESAQFLAENFSKFNTAITSVLIFNRSHFFLSSLQLKSSESCFWQKGENEIWKFPKAVSNDFAHASYWILAL